MLCAVPITLSQFQHVKMPPQFDQKPLSVTGNAPKGATTRRPTAALSQGAQRTSHNCHRQGRLETETSVLSSRPQEGNPIHCQLVNYFDPIVRGKQQAFPTAVPMAAGWTEVVLPACHFSRMTTLRVEVRRRGGGERGGVYKEWHGCAKKKRQAGRRLRRHG